MKSTIVKRSVKIAGHTTSVSLEDAFWSVLKEIASGRNMSVAKLITFINSKREHPNLSSAIRLFVLDHFHIQIDGGTENSSPKVETARPAKSA
jgi:predicted DNA-binding ribbon-helix-helix protein